MKKSISNVVAGGLITSATVMGLDAIDNPAAAAMMESKQTQDFTFDYVFDDVLNTATLTCCNNATTFDSYDFVFDGFDATLGVLNTVGLGISLLGTSFNTADVFDFAGHIAGVTLNDDIVSDLGAAGATVMLDTADFAKALNTVGLEFNILFEGNNVALPTSGDTRGSMTLSYIYEAAAVPIPGSAALMAPALAAMLAARAFARRRREEDE